MRTLSLIFIALISSQVVKAQMSFEDFRHSGTGCPQGTVGFSVSPDGASASILLDEFMAQVPQYDGVNDNGNVSSGRLRRTSKDPRIQHKACNLGFSVSIPEGQMVEALEVSIYNRGSTILDAGTRASLSTIFVGHQGLRNTMGGAKPSATVLERKIWGAIRDRNHVDVFDDWTSEPTHTIPVQSACANNRERSVRFELKNHLEVEIMNNNLETTGMIVMDSSDINGSLKFRVITRPCTNSGHGSGSVVRPPRPPRRYR